jgi:2-phosphoglycerate kinase
VSNSPDKFICFITGASGVGKTALAELLEIRYRDRKDIVVLKFDTIGVPSVEDQINQFGSAVKWQQAATQRWVSKMVREVVKPVIIIEGQVNFDFINEAFTAEKFTNFAALLIDCDEAEMERRLREERNQPELANPAMRNWRRFLREQAEQRGAPIINTSDKTKEEIVDEFEVILNSVKCSGPQRTPRKGSTGQ